MVLLPQWQAKYPVVVRELLQVDKDAFWCNKEYTALNAAELLGKEQEPNVDTNVRCPARNPIELQYNGGVTPVASNAPELG